MTPFLMSELRSYIQDTICARVSSLSAHNKSTEWGIHGLIDCIFAFKLPVIVQPSMFPQSPFSDSLFLA